MSFSISSLFLFLSAFHGGDVMSCLGPNDDDLRVLLVGHKGDARMVAVDEYDRGRLGGAPREAGSLPWRDGALRDALLLAPELRDGHETDFLGSYQDWWRDVRAVALTRGPQAPDKTLALVAHILAAPDPTRYEQSPIGDGAMRADLQKWQDAVLAVVQKARQ